uniref:Reverse transcriptase domain-containing protein n=1 Tax=Fagus sylvatica TaxID=28930 RepID=A0A2N9EBE5_FAGSY
MTERCYSLKQHLEQLAKAGHLRRYIGDDQKQHYYEGPTVAHNTKPAVRVIEMIPTSRPNGQSHDRLRSDLKKAQHLREVFQVAEDSVISKKPRTDFPNSEQQIFFSDEDLRDVQTPHDDPLVVKLRIGDSDIKRVLIDQGSCSEIVYLDLFHGLGLKQSDLQPYDAPLVGFSRESVRSMGRITMAVHTGPISLETEFLVVNVPSPYTAIMGRKWLHKLKAVPSSLHQKLCFPTDFRIMEIKGDQVAPKQCIMAAIKQNLLGRRNRTYRFFDKQHRRVRLGSLRSAGGRSRLHSTSAERRSSLQTYATKGKTSGPNTYRSSTKRGREIIASRAIRELQYPTWLSNTVVVKKKNGKWRVCVDFTNLNQACPKDPFPLPKIDQLVDATVGQNRMSFLDAFQGYHQIALSIEDRKKTAFITPLGVYCYKVMSFGLKNASATYQQMVTKMFKDQIGRTVEIYIDDMVVKSKLSQNHLEDLTETFRTLRLHKLRLNASKCPWKAPLFQLSMVLMLQLSTKTITKHTLCYI